MYKNCHKCSSAICALIVVHGESDRSSQENLRKSRTTFNNGRDKGQAPVKLPLQWEDREGDGLRGKGIEFPILCQL